MKTADLVGKSSSELRSELESLMKEHFNLRLQHSIGQLANSAQIKRVRRDIARVKTIMNNKGE